MMIFCPANEQIAATISLDAAAREPWEVVVAGGGPAGALCAFLLARRGISVLLVDKSEFPRNKVCGSCLNGAALTALDAAGLGDLPGRLGAVPLTAMHLRSARRPGVPGARAALPLPAGVALSRWNFDAALIRAAVDAGAAFLPETEATLEPAASSPRTIQICASRGGPGSPRVRLATRIAVAADGLGGGFLLSFDDLKWIVARNSPFGAGAVIEDPSAFYPAGEIFMGCAPSGYVGIVRLEDGQLDVAMALDRGAAQNAGGTASAAIAILRASGLPCPAALASATFRGTPYLTRRRARVAADGLLVIGDAAGYVEPLTGEGMAWAMQQAILAVPIIAAAVGRSGTRYAENWQPQYERLFRYRRNVCRAAGWLRRNQRFGDLVLRMLARMPGLAAPWVRAVNRAAPQVITLTTANQLLSPFAPRK
jgi:menaquinone-9 beta-reductase